MKRKILFILVLCLIMAYNLFSGEELINEWAVLPENNGFIDIPAQKSPYSDKERTIRVYIYYPGGKITSINNLTGLFLALHNWGGTNAIGAPSPSVLSSRYNTVCIAVDYFQSGMRSPPKNGNPYDHGYLQALDALKALYYVYKGLEKKEIEFDKSRIYCTGGSGGGNISQMANKLAPRTFACIADFSGMPGLTDDIAFALPGGSFLNAGYSKNPDSPNYLTKDAQQIRDFGNPPHLDDMKKNGNNSLIFICHGEDDTACLATDKREIVKNMTKAGFKVDAHFISQKDIDGKLIKNSGHSIGDRTQLLLRFADKYFLPGSIEMQRNKVKCDFECKDDKVQYKTNNGYYLISYKKGYPVGKFVPKLGFSPKKRSPITVKNYFEVSWP